MSAEWEKRKHEFVPITMEQLDDWWHRLFHAFAPNEGPPEVEAVMEEIYAPIEARIGAQDDRRAETLK